MTKDHNSGRDPSSGHGHVYKRPDGIKARCGGPAMCSECARDMAALHASYKPQAPLSSNNVTDLFLAELIARYDAAPGAHWCGRAVVDCLRELQKRRADETSPPRSPIAWVVVAENGGICSSGIYAPGLPEGTHDLYYWGSATAKVQSNEISGDEARFGSATEALVQIRQAKCAIDKTCLEYPRCLCGTGSPEEPSRDPYKAECEGGSGGRCTEPDCEQCWPDDPKPEKATDITPGVCCCRWDKDFSAIVHRDRTCSVHGDVAGDDHGR